MLDDLSGMKFIEPESTKAILPKRMITVLKNLSIRILQAVIVLKTDNGSEFKNQGIQTYPENIEASHELIVRYESSQNSVVEGNVGIVK